MITKENRLFYKCTYQYKDKDEVTIDGVVDTNYSFMNGRLAGLINNKVEDQLVKVSLETDEYPDKISNIYVTLIEILTNKPILSRNLKSSKMIYKSIKSKCMKIYESSHAKQTGDFTKQELEYELQYEDIE